MPQRWVPLARIAGLYGLKTRQAQEVAKELGISAQRGAALLSPSEQKKMHAELMRRQRQKAVRESNAKKGRLLVYESSGEHSGFMEEADRLQFSGEELYRHLHPLVSGVDDADVNDSDTA